VSEDPEETMWADYRRMQRRHNRTSMILNGFWVAVTVVLFIGLILGWLE
jgi:hypothetical protein